MQFEVIEPNDADIHSISALYRACFNAPEKGENWTEETAYSYFQDRIAEQSIFAVLRNDAHEIVGVCCGSDYASSFFSKEFPYNNSSAFYISLIAVSSSERKRGHSIRMLKEYCSMIGGLGYSDILVRCRKENIPIQATLSKNNFSIIHTYVSELGGVSCERRVFLKKDGGR